MTLCPPRAALRGSVLVLLAAICAGLRAQVQTDIIGFGHQSFDSSLDGRHDVAQVQTTSFATYLLLTNGDIRWVGQPTGYGLPPAPTGNPYVRIAFSNDHQLGLRSDGTVEMESPPPGGPVVLDPVPPLPPGVSYVEIDAGGQQALARRSDGAVVAFGAVLGTVPPLPAGTTYVQVDAGWFHAAAVRSDGQLVAWGDNSAGQCNVLPLPAGRTYVEVACGGHHTLARRSDGSVVA